VKKSGQIKCAPTWRMRNYNYVMQTAQSAHRHTHTGRQTHRQRKAYTHTDTCHFN